MRKFVTAAILGALVLAGPTMASSANGGLTANDRTGEEEGVITEYFLPVLGALLAAAAGGVAASQLIDDEDAPTSP
jgi:hypothetical protein